MIIMERIRKIINSIRKNYGVYIGTPSLSKLSTFLSGYECAIYDMFCERYNFNSQFQLFIQMKNNLTNSSKHWSEIISDGKTQEEAFEAFFDYFDEFFERYYANSYSVDDSSMK